MALGQLTVREIGWQRETGTEEWLSRSGLVVRRSRRRHEHGTLALLPRGENGFQQ